MNPDYAFILTNLVVARLTMRRCHNALQLTKEFRGGKITFYRILLLIVELKFHFQK